MIAEYGEVTVVVSGCVDSIRNIYTDRDLDEIIASLKGESDAEVYVQWHMHPNDGHECHCSQYATDHRPYWSNVEYPEGRFTSGPLVD
jgi:hypothetical protein